MNTALEGEKKTYGKKMCANKTKSLYQNRWLYFWEAIGLQAVIFLLLILPSLTLAGISPKNTRPQIINATVSELVIIDSAVETDHQLASRVKPGCKVHILHEDSPAILQITEILAGYKNLKAVHLFSHGAPGKLIFAKGSVTTKTIRAWRISIAEWGKALDQGGDILLYGCHVAANAPGMRFVHALAEATGADVAASSDPTGHANVRADLDFEYHAGEIDTQSALAADVQFGPLFIFDWTTEGWSPNGPGSLPRVYTNVDGSGIDVSINITGNTGSYGNGTPLISASPGDDALYNSVNFGNTSQSVSITYTFSTPVFISGLTIMDIDGGSGSGYTMRDQVVVTGNSDSINPSSIAAGSNVVVDGGDTAYATGGYVSESDPSGWATFDFQTQEVDSFTIVYGSGPGAQPNPGRQRLWISDFAFFSSPTLAVISSFSADTTDGQVAVNWSTASEIGTVGFHLERLDEDTGKYVRINEQLLPGLLHSPQGGTYRYIDPSAETGKTYTYKLIEVEAGGQKRTHGPFSVNVPQSGTNAADLRATSFARNFPVTGYSRKAHKMSLTKKERLAAKVKSLRTALTTGTAAASTDRLKIGVAEPGLYYLDVSNIAAAMGEPVRNIRRWIKLKKLSLSNLGQHVTWTAAEKNRGIYFYGDKITSIYTDKNIYWLEKGPGSVMETVEGPGPDPGTGYETFSDTRHVEEDRWALTALYDDPEADYWLWDYIVSGNAELGSKDFNLPAPGSSGSGEASLTVRLKGDNTTPAQPDHHVEIRFNGTVIGEGYWDDTADYDLVLSFDGALLNDGDNTVTVTGLLDTGANASIFYVNSLALSYQRFYRAVDDKIRVRGDDNEVVTVDGFSTEAIYVFDVTDPWNTRFVEAVTVDGADGNHRVSFIPDTPQSQYLAVADNAALPPLTLTIDQPSTLRATENEVDYLIIAPEVMKTAAQGLADYRQGQGLITMVADIEDIYDEFSNGIVNPEAIHDFLSYAYHNWSKAPRYVVLAGKGNYDYKDNQGHGGNLVPPILVSTPHGLFASDNHYADVEGFDGLPDLIIGRLPVLTSKELETLVDKMIAYESAGGGEWTGKVLMLADNPDDGGNFPADSDDMAQLIPPAYTAEKIYRSDHPIEEAHQLVLDGINTGAFWVNYTGHAGLDRLAQEGMLVTDDVSTLSNGEKLPLLSAMTCVVGRFEVPGYASLGEELVLHDQGGAVAVWAPTGLSMNTQAKILNQELFQAIFHDQEKILGEAVKKALEGFFETDNTAYILHIYNLLGDPALQMK